jgi:hypothetical protein
MEIYPYPAIPYISCIYLPIALYSGRPLSKLLHEEMMSKLKATLLRNTALILGSAIFSLLICEILIRAFGLISPPVSIPGTYRADSLLGYSHVPNANQKTEYHGKKNHFVTDSDGYRINYRGEVTNPEVSILVIGDSYIEALGVENEETVSGVLAQRLSDKYSLRVKAVNAGVAGWSPNHYYQETKRSLALRKYDLGIIFLYLGNDHVTAIDTTHLNDLVPAPDIISLPKSLRLSDIKASIFRPLSHILERKSRVYFLIRYMGTWMSAGPISPRPWPDISPADTAHCRWTAVGEICTLINQQFQQYQTPVIFVFIPTIFQASDKAFTKYISQRNMRADQVDRSLPDKKLAEELTRRSLQYIDLFSPLQEYKSAENIYGEIDSHFTLEGHTIVAGYVQSEVEAVLDSVLKAKMIGH